MNLTDAPNSVTNRIIARLLVNTHINIQRGLGSKSDGEAAYWQGRADATQNALTIVRQEVKYQQFEITRDIKESEND